MKTIDFIAIGDITIDAFITLEKNNAHVVRGEHGKEEICMSFGDKIPYETVEVVYAVGNSPNAAVSAARLGLSSALVANLGADENGNRCVDSLKKDGVETQYVKQHGWIKTNYHYVLRYEAERTILIKHETYPYILPKDMPTSGWLYLSSLGENSLPYHADVVHWLMENTELKVAFQPGTFQIKLGYEKLKDLYARSELFFCNVQEAQRILEMPDEENIKKLLAAMRERGPKTVVITDGPRGAYTFDGSEYLQMPMYPDPAPPVERTGAGDAFSSTFTAALALGHNIPTALSWSPINSMSVVQEIGAQKGLLSREKLEGYLAKAPEDYRPKKLS